MRSISSFFSRENLSHSFEVLLKRFPLPTGMALALTAYAWYLIFSSDNSFQSFRIIITVIVTFFLSVALILFAEARNKKTWIGQIAALLYGGIFYMYFIGGSDWHYDIFSVSFLHFTAFSILLFVAPYIGKKTPGIYEYSNYIARIAWIILMSIVVGAALGILGFIAITALIQLFDLSGGVYENLYGYWGSLTLLLMAPLYGLSQLPRPNSINQKTFDTNAFLSFLIRFIAIPFIIVYFVILYAYTLRVLMDFGNWPKQTVSWLVIAFSIFGYITYMFARSYEQGNRVIEIFRRYFPIIVLPQLAMLGYAIYLRIAQYDLTMNRYFVVIFGCWLLGISLYYIFSQKKSLRVIPMSLSLIALVISIGPWSVSGLPLARQDARLMNQLKSAGMISSTGAIVPVTGLNRDQSSEIYSGLQYVCQYDDCIRIKALFPTQMATLEAKSRADWEKWNTTTPYPGLRSWEILQSVTEYLGVASYTLDTTEQPFTYFSLNGEQYYRDIFPLDVKGYDRVIRLSGGGEKMPLNNDSESLSVDVKKEKLIYQKGGVTTEYSLSEFNQGLQKKLDALSPSAMPQSDMTAEFASGSIRVIFEGYSLKNPKYQGSNGTDYYPSASGYGLVRN